MGRAYLGGLTGQQLFCLKTITNMTEVHKTVFEPQKFWKYVLWTKVELFGFKYQNTKHRN